MIAKIVSNDTPIILKHIDISFGTKLHGGYNTATVKAELSGKINNSRLETFYFKELKITDETAETLFSGRIMGVTLDDNFVEIRATGYGISATNDILYQSTSTTQANVSTIIAEVLNTTYCPELSSTQKISSNTTQAVRYSDHAEYPFEIASRLSSLADSGGNMWTFAVWDDRIPSFYSVYSGQYRRDWVIRDDENVNFSYDTSAEDLRNKVRVISMDDDGVPNTSAFTSDVLEGYPTREAEYTVTRAVSPSQVSSMMLSQNRRPKASISISLRGTIQREFGGKFPVEFVRAGDFIDISQLKQTGISNTIDLKNVLVLATEYSNGVLTITPGV